jgi:formylglycine-generating enzyme required for sulfatase activity
MSAQSSHPEDSRLLFRDERKVITWHAGSSPRAADIAFASLAYEHTPGQLNRYVLHSLGANYVDLPTPDMLSDGFHVRETPSGVRVVFVVTMRHEREAQALLRANLGRALGALGSELAGKTLWLPLMGTGAAGLQMGASLDITLETLLEAELGKPGQPARVQIDLPLDLPRSLRQKLFQQAQMRVEHGFSSPLDDLRRRRRSPTLDRGINPSSSEEPGRVASKEQALAGLLAALFDADGLRRWAHASLGEDVYRALPGAPVAFNELCFQIVMQAQQRGLVNERFFARLIEERPAQDEPIRRTAALWGNAVPVQQPGRHAQPRFADELTRMLSEQLADAYARKQALEAAGVDTGEVMQEILRLKRDIRTGGQLRAGDRLGDGRYLLLERIGRGGFANVWKALDQVSRELVAIKVLHSELAGDVVRRERFFRGARIMADLDHPSVVRIIEPRGEDDGYHFFVMELVPGGDLRRAVLERRVDASAVVPLLLDLGAALTEAHARGYVHRDIKPANVLLTEAGEPRLTDFDLVAAAETTGGTQTGALGTFIYAAPEVMDRPQDADARADVYGLGMTAAFVLHGADLPRAVIRDAMAFIAKLTCDEPLKRLLQRAVAWEVDERFADASAFCRALRTQVQATPRIEPSGPTPERSQPVPGEALAESFVEPATGIRFLLVPGGRFAMGERKRSESSPRHQVEVSSFWLAELPVTRLQYGRFLAPFGRREPVLLEKARFHDPNQPVVGVTWLDAYSFCQWASRISGLAVSLPTEAQWEFAARGPEGRPYPWGSEEPDALRAQFDRHWLKDAPLPVGSLPGSRGPFGHLDQAGNVWEWCLDSWDASAYARRGVLTVDPVELDTGDTKKRVVRGGGFTSMALELHAAYRNAWQNDDGSVSIGFRVAAMPQAKGKSPHGEDVHREDEPAGGGASSS